jgi:hypothetical protein
MCVCVLKVLEKRGEERKEGASEITRYYFAAEIRAITPESAHRSIRALYFSFNFIPLARKGVH